MPYKSNTELPASVKVLPEHAKTIFRKAYNAAYSEHGEEGAFKIAWAAVKNAGYKKQGGRWVKTDAIYLQAVTLDNESNIRITSDGYMVAQPRVARKGIQIYKGYELGVEDMEEVRVYRPETEVFHNDSLHSYAHRTVTNNHPPVMVGADNWKAYAVGHTGDEVVRDGEFIRVPLVLMDSSVIKSVKDGKRQLSLGYTADIVWGLGKSPEGEEFDAMQTNIRANHLAIVSEARGGPLLNIGDSVNDDDEEEEFTDMPDKVLKTIQVDGLPVEITDIGATVVERHITNLNKQIADVTTTSVKDRETSSASITAANDKHKKEIETKDAEIATLKKQLEDAQITPQKLDAMVRDRSEVIVKAKGVIGDALVVDGKTDVEIRRQVVNAKLGDAAKSWSDDAIKASFDTLTRDVKTSPGTNDSLRDGLAHLAPSASSLQTSFADREKAYDERNELMRNAWRGPATAKAS